MIIFELLFPFLLIYLLVFVAREVARKANLNKGYISDKYYIDEFGYYRFQNSGKSLHRYIAEKKLGRRLYYDEVVHHIDRNKRNNRPENLYVCTPGEHQAIHNHNLKNYGYW